MKFRHVGLLIIGLIGSMSHAYGQDLQVRASFRSGQWIDRDETITLRLSRPLQSSDGKLAVFIGPTDMTDLFVSMTNSLTYTPTIFLLPSGETELIINLVSPNNEWREIARFPLKVRTRIGFEKAKIDPNLSINNNGQIAEGHSPDTNEPSRSTYQDFTGQANLSSEHIRESFAIRSQWDFVGASEQNQTLRFGEKGDDAAKIDLSNYMLQLQVGKSEFSMGHINHGRQRHLINFYGSRGIKLQATYGSWIDFSAAAMNGTSIVGWDNFVGLSNRDHRIYSGTLGLEIIKNQPGAIRLEGSVMDALLLPQNNFNQGVINDSEESRGFGFRIQASDKTQRVQLEGGFARSQFSNPEDPLLSQGAALVEVKETTRNARYLNVGLGILQNLSLSQTWQTNLNINLRHERVDPLYRSLAAFARADFMENAVDVQGNIGVINAQYSHSRSEDNLDEIPSILKTKTRNNSVSVGLPLGLLLNRTTGPPKWLPMLSYNFNRTHQFGDSLPINSGFSESHVPDQVSNSHNAGLDWQGNRWRFGYQLSYNLQDNRQVGRENSDFENVNNSFSLGLTPFNRLNLNLDIAFENAENKEQDQSELTKRYGITFSLKTTGASTLNANFSTTNSEDGAKTRESNNTFINAQWSLSFRLKRSANRQLLQGQVFIRYTRNESDSKDRVFDFESDLSNWSVKTGVNFSVL